MILLQVNIILAQNDADVDYNFVYGPGPNSAATTYVNTVAFRSDGKMYAGGNFTFYNGLAQNRFVRINIDGTKDTSFNIGTGFNDNVYCIAQQSDGKVLVGGNFINFNGVTQGRLIRLNTDGSKDTSFNIGSGFNNTVYSIAIQSDGKILVGGFFSTYNGTTQNALVRLNSDGSKDTSFNIGTSVNFNVWCFAIQSDGKILVGGDYTTFNGVSQNGLVRLNTNGTKDTSFNIGSGFNTIDGAFVASLALQSDGKIIAVGGFTSFNGATQNRLIRLNTDGSKDTSYIVGQGFNATASAIALQSDGKAVVVGNYSTYKGQLEARLIRLNSDGSKDTTFNITTGFNNSTSSVAIHSDGKILIGGFFNIYKNNPADYLVRLKGTSVLSSDSFQKNNFSVFPNPVNDILNIQMDSDIKNIEVFSLQGQLVMQSTLKSFSLNSLNHGVYLVKITDVNGVIVTQKIIKN